MLEDTCKSGVREVTLGPYSSARKWLASSLRCKAKTKATSERGEIAGISRGSAEHSGFRRFRRH